MQNFISFMCETSTMMIKDKRCECSCELLWFGLSLVKLLNLVFDLGLCSLHCSWHPTCCMYYVTRWKGQSWELLCDPDVWMGWHSLTGSLSSAPSRHLQRNAGSAQAALLQYFLQQPSICNQPPTLYHHAESSTMRKTVLVLIEKKNKVAWFLQQGARVGQLGV